MIIKDSKQQKEEYFRKLAEDGGKLNLTVKGFINEIILPPIKWVMAKRKPG
jgi:hypothetical protein